MLIFCNSILQTDKVTPRVQDNADGQKPTLNLLFSLIKIEPPTESERLRMEEVTTYLFGVHNYAVGLAKIKSLQMHLHPYELLLNLDCVRSEKQCLKVKFPCNVIECKGEGRAYL